MKAFPGWTALMARWTAVSPRWKAILALVMMFAAGLDGGALLEDIADDIERPAFAAEDDDDDDDGDYDDAPRAERRSR